MVRVRDAFASRVRLAPDLGEPLRAAAAPFVVLVAHWILVVIILVVVLCRREGGRRLDLGRDRLLEARGELLFLRLRQLLLLVIAEEDGAVIGGPLVAELTVRIERVDILPIMIEQLGVGDLGGVVGHLDRFQIALMITIGGVGLCAAGIAGDRLGD